MGVDLKEVIETENETAEPIMAHIVDRGDDERPAAAIILEARINGTPVTALCGHVFVPERDPRNHPICQKCVEMFEFAADFRGIDL